MERTITATEALYGFMSWLTCRDATLVIGASHGAAEPAELVRAFLEANGIKEAIPEDWPKHLVYPKI
jgi:hypothetical protein